MFLLFIIITSYASFMCIVHLYLYMCICNIYYILVVQSRINKIYCIIVSLYVAFCDLFALITLVLVFLQIQNAYTIVIADTYCTKQSQ